MDQKKLLERFDFCIANTDKTIAEIAKEIGISREAYYKFKNGTQMMRSTFLKVQKWVNKREKQIAKEQAAEEMV